MTEYLTEQEQIELLKNWIKQYSPVILTGILIAIVAISGWRYWQQRQNNTFAHASSVYDEMLTMRAQNESKATRVQAEKLFLHYPHTVYSQMSALVLAREAVNEKNYKEAETRLNWVLTNSHIPALKQIAKLRLARILLTENKSEDALALLQKNDDKTFAGLVDEVRGDAYLMMKNIEMARQSYKKALSELPNAESIRPLLQMKYDNLATS